MSNKVNDEDFEESNAIDDYLSKHDSNNDELPEITNSDTDSDENEPKITNSFESNTKSMPCLLGSLIGLSEINEFLNNSNKLIFDSDMKILLHSHLKTKNLVRNSLKFTEFISQNKPTFQYTLPALALSLLASPKVATLFILISFVFFLLTKFNASLNQVQMSKSIKLSEDYLKNLNSLLSYLKEVEFLSLSTKRRFLIEKSQANIQPRDTLNYEFRKLVFNKLREHFFTLKNMNKRHLNRLDVDIFELDKSEFISEIKDHELGEVMLVDDEENQSKLSDDYDLKCIKSIKKLIQLLISENLKIFKLNELDLQLKSIKLNIINSVFSTFFDIFEFKNQINKFLIDVNNLNNIVTLMDNLNDEKVDSKPMVNKSDDMTHLLRVHLRNCYLMSLSVNDNKEEMLKMLKLDFEFCELYLKRLLNETESKGEERKLESPVDLDALNDAMRNDDDEDRKLFKDNHEEINEDEIFEADNRTIDTDNVKKVTNDEEISLKNQETYLIGKNLLYELKFALKDKRVEWKKRERLAKKTIDGKVLRDDHIDIDEFEDLDDGDGYILENDALKYKSEIRKKRANRDAPKVEEESGDEESLEPTGVNLVLKEFMLKRNDFFTNTDDDDEIILE